MINSGLHLPLSWESSDDGPRLVSSSAPENFFGGSVRAAGRVWGVRDNSLVGAAGGGVGLDDGAHSEWILPLVPHRGHRPVPALVVVHCRDVRDQQPDVGIFHPSVE